MAINLATRKIFEKIAMRTFIHEKPYEEIKSQEFLYLKQNIEHRPKNSILAKFLNQSHSEDIMLLAQIINKQL